MQYSLIIIYAMKHQQIIIHAVNKMVNFDNIT